MLFDYVTKSGQTAKIEAANAQEALAKATNIDPHSGVSISTNQVDSSSPALPPLQSSGEKSLPPVAATVPEKQLPPTSSNTTSRLLQFSSALDTATRIAQKKRLDFQSNILKQGVAPGVRSASDFTGVISSLDNTDQSFIKPITNTALDLAKSNAGDVTSIAKSAAAGGAPASVINRILSSDTPGDALIAAGEFIQDKTTVPGDEKKKYSGSLEYTGADLSEGSSKLESSRGDDNYVDPTVYLNMYKSWVTAGGLPQDFVTNYPPKNYVNPANDWLPAPLRSATGSFTQDNSDISSQIDSLFK